MSGNYSFCDIEWCYFLKAKKNGTSYQEPTTNLIPGIHDREIDQVRAIINKYTTDERIREMLHELDTQICEAINNALTFLAPKNKNFSRTKSLLYRIAHVIGMHNEGQLYWFQCIFFDLGINMSPAMEKYLLVTDATKSKRQEKQANFEVRRKRAHGFASQMRSEILRQRTEGTTYQTNLFIDKTVNSRAMTNS